MIDFSFKKPSFKLLKWQIWKCEIHKTTRAFTFDCVFLYILFRFPGDSFAVNIKVPKCDLKTEDSWIERTDNDPLKFTDDGSDDSILSTQRCSLDTNGD